MIAQLFHYIIYRSRPPLKTISLLLPAIFIIAGCAGGKASRKETVPPIKYRVALLNAGAYRALGDQAAMDLQSFGEVDLVVGPRLDSILSGAGISQMTLVNAASFDELARVDSLDFALVLLPAPAAYPTGSVGLRSINWRTSTIKTNPAVKVPERTVDWLLETRNGWVKFTSDPTGAIVTVGDSTLGRTPVLAMVDHIRFNAMLQWTPKVSKTVEVDIDDRNWVHVLAPEDYYAKHHKTGLYARLQAADEEHGETFFIIIYVIAILASIGLLFYNPIQQ